VRRDRLQCAVVATFANGCNAERMKRRLCFKRLQVYHSARDVRPEMKDRRRSCGEHGRTPARAWSLASHANTACGVSRPSGRSRPWRVTWRKRAPGTFGRAGRTYGDSKFPTSVLLGSCDPAAQPRRHFRATGSRLHLRSRAGARSLRCERERKATHGSLCHRRATPTDSVGRAPSRGAASPVAAPAPAAVISPFARLSRLRPHGLMTAFTLNGLVRRASRSSRHATRRESCPLIYRRSGLRGQPARLEHRDHLAHRARRVRQGHQAHRESGR